MGWNQCAPLLRCGGAFLFPHLESGLCQGRVCEPAGSLDAAPTPGTIENPRRRSPHRGVVPERAIVVRAGKPTATRTDTVTVTVPRTVTVTVTVTATRTDTATVPVPVPVV